MSAEALATPFGAEVPVHIRMYGLGRFALSEITDRDTAAYHAGEAASHLWEVEAVESMGVLGRLRERAAVRSWLNVRGYPTLSHARSWAVRGQESSLIHLRDREARAADSLDELRVTLGHMNTYGHEHIDAVMRHNGADALVAACDEAAAADGVPRTLGAWLAAADGSGATRAHLEQAVRWSATEAQRHVEEGTVATMLAASAKRITDAADQGLLSPALAQEPPRIKRIEVGEPLDREFLRNNNNQNTYGQYERSEQTLTIWPYADGKKDTSRTASHELLHAKGGFDTAWLNEGFTERFSIIAHGMDPDDQPANHIYRLERSIITDLMQAASLPITDREASEAYAGPDGVSNEAQLRAVFTRAYEGYDILAALADMPKYVIAERYPDGKAPIEDYDAIQVDNLLALDAAADWIASQRDILYGPQASPLSIASLEYGLTITASDLNTHPALRAALKMVASICADRRQQLASRAPRVPIAIDEV